MEKKKTNLERAQEPDTSPRFSRRFLICEEYSKEGESRGDFLGYTLEVLQDDKEEPVDTLRSESLGSLAVKLRENNVQQSDDDRITTLRGSRADGDRIYGYVDIMDLFEFSRAYYKARSPYGG